MDTSRIPRIVHRALGPQSTGAFDGAASTEEDVSAPTGAPDEAASMLAEKTRLIDARWDEINPAKGELVKQQRASLPYLLEDGELPQKVVVGKDTGFSVWNVLMVATDRRVLRITSGETKHLHYDDILGATLSVLRIPGSRPVIQILGQHGNLSVQAFDAHDAHYLVAYVKGEDMSSLEEQRARSLLIDQQWNGLKPAWWGDRHKGEREMLHSLVDEGETLEALIGGTYRAEQDTSRRHRHQGVAVATSKRVLFVDKGVMGNTEVSEMPYRSIEAITYSTGAFFAGIQITGRGIASFRIEDIADKDSVKPFVDCVRGHLEAAHAPQAAAPQPAAPTSVADEIEKLASLKDRGILTQEEFDAKKRQLLGL